MLGLLEEQTEEFCMTNQSPKADMLLRYNDAIVFGAERSQAISTPKHSPSSVSLLENTLVFTRDTLFAGIDQQDRSFGNALNFKCILL